MNDEPHSKTRLLLSRDLSVEQSEAAADRAWKEVFGEDLSKNGSFHHYLFLASQYAGEQCLKNRGLQALFRQTQQLPDYPRANDALKRGWARWMELAHGISIDQDKDRAKIAQYRLLKDLRRAPTREARQEFMRRRWAVIGQSAKRGDDDFFRRLGYSLNDPPRSDEGANDFAQVLLHNWLTGFWWLMPANAVAADIARIQGHPDDMDLWQSFKQRLWKIRSRKAKNTTGAFFSAGWNGCFYSTTPVLIDSIGSDGKPLLTTVGRRLLPPLTPG